MSRVLELICHPDTPCGADIGLIVEVDRRGAGALHLDYRITGEVEKLLLPAPGRPLRADELWRTSCLELFVQDASRAGPYREHNFAPSRAWAAYDFSGYREGMEKADMPAPEIRTESGARHFSLNVRLLLPGDGPVHAGLSAVIEERGGGISYWALAHPPGKPDFHHPACFALQLPAGTGA